MSDLREVSVEEAVATVPGLNLIGFKLGDNYARIIMSDKDLAAAKKAASKMKSIKSQEAFKKVAKDFMYAVNKFSSMEVSAAQTRWLIEAVSIGLHVRSLVGDIDIHHMAFGVVDLTAETKAAYSKLMSLH